MSKYVVLFNAKSNSGNGETLAKEVEKTLPDSTFEYVDTTKLEDFTKFFKSRDAKENYILCGGDGTLNYFINHVAEKDVPANLFYFATGTGNDFLTDIGGKKGEAPIQINKYLKELPSIEINGKTYKFINGVGYGIDGYCCEVGDKERLKSTKPVNYTSIAIKGLLFHFHPANAKVTVDGVTKSYKKVWLAPIMHGRYYGGGMMPTPSQDRLAKEKTLSVCVWHGSGKLKTLINFPSYFEGKHLLKPKMCEVITGKNIVVEFSKPIAAQVDGETVLGVTKIEGKVFAKK